MEQGWDEIRAVCPDTEISQPHLHPPPPPPPPPLPTSTEFLVSPLVSIAVPASPELNVTQFSLIWPYLDDCGEFYLGLMAAKWVLMILTRHLYKYTVRCQENWKI